MNIVAASESTFPSLWHALWVADLWQSPFATPIQSEYSCEYAAPATFTDYSFVVEESGTPLAGLMVAQRHGEEVSEAFSAFGRPMMFLEAAGMEAGVRRRAYRKLSEQLSNLLESHAGAVVHYRDFLVDGTLSFVGRHLLELGAKATPHFTQVLDLTRSEEVLRRHIRQSYRSLINWGKQHLNPLVIDAQTVQPEHIEEFRQLHVQEAGRETRSRRTWELQYEMVRHGEAFLVLGTLDGELVTAAQFLFSEVYCYYGVGASRRDLHDKPLSHAVLWTAVEHAKTLGCRFFEMGEQSYPSQSDPAPSKKLLGISTFKRGFGGKTQVRLDIKGSINV